MRHERYTYFTNNFMCSIYFSISEMCYSQTIYTYVRYAHRSIKIKCVFNVRIFFFTFTKHANGFLHKVPGVFILFVCNFHNSFSVSVFHHLIQQQHLLSKIKEFIQLYYSYYMHRERWDISHLKYRIKVCAPHKCTFSYAHIYIYIVHN